MCDIIIKLKGDTRPLPIPSILKPEPLFTGKQLIEILLPESFDYIKTNNSVFDENVVYFKNGKYITGVLCKKVLGTSEGGIIHMLWLMYGDKVANMFISNVQYAINHWLTSSGFSIGAMDIFIDKNDQREVDLIIKNAKTKVNQILDISENNKNIDYNIFENKINHTLNNAMSQAGLKVQENIPRSNNINTSVIGGSKGSMFNIAQIMGCVGQQNVSGKRVDFGYIERVLPHFERNDVGPAASRPSG